MTTEYFKTMKNMNNTALMNYIADELIVCKGVKTLSYSAEFLEGNLSVSIGVGIDDGLVDYLLQLRVFQVVADHHFQHLKQLAV